MLAGCGSGIMHKWNELDDLEYGGDVLKSSCDELGKCEYIPVFSGLLRVVYFVKAFSF